MRGSVGAGGQVALLTGVIAATRCLSGGCAMLPCIPNHHLHMAEAGEVLKLRMCVTVLQRKLAAQG